MQTGLNRVEAESIDDEDFLVEMTQWSKNWLRSWPKGMTSARSRRSIGKSLSLSAPTT